MAGPWEEYQTAPAAKPAAKKSTWDKKAPLNSLTPQQRKESFDALRQSDAIMNREMKSLTGPQRKKALATYYANPTIQRLRQEAGLPAVRTRQEELADIARKQFRQEKKLRPEGDFGAGLRAGSERAAFGIPERIGAALNYYGGVSDPTVKSYSEELDVQRMVNELQRGRSTTGNVLGQLLGGTAGAAGATGAVRGAGELVASVAPRAGNFIQNLTRLNAGARGANAAKIIAGGAAGGGAQALGEGSNVTTGAVTGAVAAPLVVGGLKAGEWATRPVRDFLRASSATGILRRFTNATREQITRAADDFRASTGREPTVFEVLPAQDRQAVEGLLKKMPGQPRERATELVRERVSAMPRELSERTQEITAPQQRFMAREMALDLARARGAPNPTADELALAQRAVRDPTEMEMVRRTVSRSIMQPFDDRVAFENVGEMLPTAPVNQGNGRIVEEISDQGVANAIRSVSKPRAQGPDGISVRDVTDMISDLRADARAGGIEGRNAGRAADHLEDLLGQRHPDAAEALARMNAAHAARSRMLEGAKEGRMTRLREDVPVKGATDANKVRNAYDSPEGAAGRAVGQRAELLTDFAGKPNVAVGRAGDIADSPGVQEAIGRNLGPQAGGEIADMAGAQSESLRRLSRLRTPQAGENQEMDFGDLAMSMSLLSPTSLIRTKSQSLGILMRVFAGIPEGRANQIVEALFSREPAQMSNALRMLDSAGERGQRALRDIVGSIAIGAQAGRAANGVDDQRSNMDNFSPEPAATEGVTEEAPQEQGPWDAYADEGGAPDARPYGRAVIEELFPDAEVTDDLRDPESPLGRANPGSYHNSTDGAVDVRPIPGMTFDEFIDRIRAEGYEIIEARDEVKNPSGHATGPHWHVVLA